MAERTDGNGVRQRVREMLAERGMEFAEGPEFQPRPVTRPVHGTAGAGGTGGELANAGGEPDGERR